MMMMMIDGKEGLFPHIPPNTTLIFDITLLEFRPRSTWVKPLIQELGITNEKPYIKDLKISLEKAHALGQGHRIAQVRQHLLSICIVMVVVDMGCMVWYAVCSIL